MKGVILKAWYFVFKIPPGRAFGNIIYPLLPEYIKKKCIASYFQRKGFIGFITNTISHKLDKEYFSGSEEEIRKANRELYWGAYFGRSWHNLERSKYSSIEEYISTDAFIKFRKPLIDQVKVLNFKNVCEIGTGNGLFIRYLSETLPAEKFYGLDINKETIEENKNIYADSGITFLADSNNDFLYNQLPDDVLIISVGTLECFTKAELEELLTSLKNSNKKVTISLSEPFDLDLNSEDSVPREGSALFSHAYEKILTRLQFRIVSILYLKRKTEDPRVNYIIVTASNY
ncbi:MAG: class I SAM-dependent methyltransferase [Bacteroidota bacterium]